MKFILGNGSKSVRSSSNQRSNGGWRTTRSREERFSEWCGCGCRPILRWSETDANPERLFFECPNYNSVGKRWCGLFVWANKFHKKGEARGRVVPKNENDEEWRMNFV